MRDDLKFYISFIKMKGHLLNRLWNEQDKKYIGDSCILCSMLNSYSKDCSRPYAVTGIEMKSIKYIILYIARQYNEKRNPLHKDCNVGAIVLSFLPF